MPILTEPFAHQFTRVAGITGKTPVQVRMDMMDWPVLGEGFDMGSREMETATLQLEDSAAQCKELVRILKKEKFMLS